MGKKSLIEKLMKNVSKDPETGCWEWMASKNAGGYGRIRAKNTMCLAHRISWEIFCGDIPRGLCVCHKCDNPSCVNPDHLFIGTRQDNMDDMLKKGRYVKGKTYKGIECPIRGSLSPRSKLTEKDVIEIRRRYKEGNASYRSLAKEFGVCYRNIACIIKKKMWAWLTDFSDAKQEYSG